MGNPDSKYWQAMNERDIYRKGSSPDDLLQTADDIATPIAGALDFENMSISELMEWLADDLLNAEDADYDEANRNNANIAQETLYNKVAAGEGSDYELMNAGNYFSKQGISTPYSEDSEDTGTPYVEGFQALPAGHDWTRTSLSPWEQAQMGQMGTENQLAQRTQDFAQGTWGQEFGRSGEQWREEFDWNKALDEAGLESSKRGQKLEEDKWTAQKWQMWNQIAQDEARLRGSFADKAAYIQSGLAQTGHVPNMPAWMGEYGATQSKLPFSVAAMRPLGAQAGAQLTPEQQRVMGATARWEGLEGYGPKWGGVSSSPMQTSKRW